jgi:colicin import membrane protein
VTVSLPQATFQETIKMTTENKMPVTLENLYAEILEIKTLLRSAPPALAASVAKKVGKVSKKAAAAAADGSAPAEPKAPSTNPWILFTKRVDAVLKTKYEAEGTAKEEKLTAAAAKQFASDLKGRKPYAEWTDEDIVAALDGWAPPEVSKQTAEGKSKKQKKAASAPSSAAGSEAGSDDESEGEAEPAEKPKRKWSEEAKKAAAEKRAAKKAAKAAEAAPALADAPAAEDAEEEKPAEAPAEKPKKTVAIKPKAKPAEAAPKKVDLRFFSWTHNGTDYFTNDRGDVVTTEFEWVGRYNGEKVDESVPEPADLAQAEMRE